MPAEDHCYNAPERDVYLLVDEYKQAMNDPAVIQLKETNKTLLMFNKTQLMISMNFKSYGNLTERENLQNCFVFYLRIFVSTNSAQTFS